MAKLIEMVCTANVGRSTVAELMARKHLKKIGAADYQVISSGTSVDGIVKGELPLPFKVKIVEQARQRGDIYSPTEASDVDAALKSGNDEAVTGFYAKAVKKFEAEELQNRKDVLHLFGLNEGILKTTQDQTFARPNTAAVFSMGKSNNAQVRKIYFRSRKHRIRKYGSPLNPIISTLSAYATGNPNTEIPNAFGKCPDVYKAVVVKIAEHVPKAINKLLG